MTALSKEYLLLFNAVTDTERALSQLREALLDAQRQAEELFLEEESDPPPNPDQLHKPPEKPLTFRHKWGTMTLYPGSRC